MDIRQLWDDRMTEWLRKGARVYSKGEGKSYNCTNIATAKQLHETLTNYETTTTLNKNITKQYHHINQQIIQLKLSVHTLTHEINNLHETIQQIEIKQSQE